MVTQWIQSYLCKKQTSQETQKSLQKVLEPANIVKIFPGIILRQHRTDRKLMGLLTEQCAESRERTSAVLLQSGLDEK